MDGHKLLSLEPAPCNTQRRIPRWKRRSGGEGSRLKTAGQVQNLVGSPVQTNIHTRERAGKRHPRLRGVGIPRRGAGNSQPALRGRGGRQLAARDETGWTDSGTRRLTWAVWAPGSEGHHPRLSLLSAFDIS